MRTTFLAIFISTIISYPLLADISPPFLSPQEKRGHDSTLSLIRQEIQTQKWKDLCSLITSGLHKNLVTFKELHKLSLSFPDSPFFSAVQATKKILCLKDKTGLNARIVFPIALFAETYLKEEVAKGHKFFPKSLFGRDLGYDTEMHRLFIHLGTIGVSPIGEGRSKVVTKTILYDRFHPKVCAHGITARDVENEVYAMRKLRGVQGVIQAEALLTHKNHHNKKKITGIVTPIYNRGSLESFLENYGSDLSLKERLGIARDLIVGLAGMHQRGFVHRDLGVRNHFVHVTNGHGNKGKIVAVIADLGRTLLASESDGHYVQGNSHYLCPEGFFQSKMKGKDYYASDVFALGVVFWQLYFNRFPDWSYPRYFKKESWPIKKRYRAHMALLKKTRARYLSYIKSKKSHGKLHGCKDKFLSLILQMTHPNPKSRGSASSLKSKFVSLAK